MTSQQLDLSYFGENCEGYFIDLSYCPTNKQCKIISPNRKQIIKTDSDVVFNYVRGQIARCNYSGWKIEFEGKEYNITSNGDIENWPDGLFKVNELLNSYLYNSILKQETVVGDDYMNLLEELTDKDVEPEVIRAQKLKK